MKFNEKTTDFYRAAGFVQENFLQKTRFISQSHAYCGALILQRLGMNLANSLPLISSLTLMDLIQSHNPLSASLKFETPELRLSLKVKHKLENGFSINISTKSNTFSVI